MTSEQTLKSRVILTAFWMLGSNVFSQFLRLLSNLLLTRLLAPAAFGLMATVSTIYFALSMFSDLGVWQSVIKSPKGEDTDFLGTAQTIEFLRGLLLAGLVLLTAVGIYTASQTGFFTAHTVYANARLPGMVAFVGACALLDGMVSMKLALAQRRLHGDRVAKLELASQLAAVSVTILTVWLTGSVWGLLWGWLVSSATRVVLSYVYLPGVWCKPCWDVVSAHEIIHYGKWIFASSIIGFLADNGEKIIFGNYFSIGYFGIFSIATALLTAIAAIYSTLLGRVIFPSLSLALNDSLGIVRAYARAQQSADLFVGILAGGLLTAGQWVVWGLYDARYHDAGWMLQVLGMCMLGLRYQVVEQLMFAMNRPDLVTVNNVIRAVGLVVFIPIGFYLGQERGAIIAVVFAQFLTWPLCMYFKWKHGLFSFQSETWWLPAFTLGLLAGYVLTLLIGCFILQVPA